MSDPVTLGDLIAELEALEKLDQHDSAVPFGFKEPHSYRGFYEQLAVEPSFGKTVRDLLACAREANGSVYIGYKGGEYVMSRNTSVHFAEYGSTGVPMTHAYLELLRDAIEADL